MKPTRFPMRLTAAFVLSLTATVPTRAGGDGPHWSYHGTDGPSNWAGLSPGFAACGAGRMQSPIDLAGANAASAVEVAFDYRPTGLSILNNGHTVQFNVGNGSSMTSHGTRFELLQVHFHTPSEHVVDGDTFPMEAHFVHKTADGRLGVIGVFFREGAENEALAPVTAHAPTRDSHGARAVEGVTIDPRALIPASPRFYRYMGSLTTPPCSEGVNWFVAGEPLTASRAQISALSRAYGGPNARPAQPANNRLILEASN